MANYTTNYNLKKPLGSENYNVADQNGNMDLIDAAMKANADAIAKDEEGIAYRLGNTNTTGATLAVGTYVYVTGNTNGVSNGMYKVTTAIAANGSLTTSNLGSVPGGVANSLNSKFANHVPYIKNGSITQVAMAIASNQLYTIPTGKSGWYWVICYGVDADHGVRVGDITITYISSMLIPLKEGTEVYLSGTIQSGSFLYRVNS